MLLSCSCTQAPPPPEPTPAPAPSAVERLANLVPGPIRADGRLLVGTDPNYPPMEFLKPDGATLQGADVDLIVAVATILGLEPVFEYEPFTALPQAVRTGRAEVGIAALTIQGRRHETNAVLYLRSATRLVTSAGAAGLTPDTMCGHRIAVLDGSVQVVTLKKADNACRRSGENPITIVGRSDQATITQLTAARRVSGMLTGSPAALYAVRASGGALVLADPPIRPSQLGIVVAPELGNLARAVRGAVQELIDSGVYREILQRWNVARGALARARIVWSDFHERRARQRQEARSRGRGQ
jgi:polar amino acid transport system substrate-binding protein